MFASVVRPMRDCRWADCAAAMVSLGCGRRPLMQRCMCYNLCECPNVGDITTLQWPAMVALCHCQEPRSRPRSSGQMTSGIPIDSAMVSRHTPVQRNRAAQQSVVVGIDAVAQAYGVCADTVSRWRADAGISVPCPPTGHAAVGASLASSLTDTEQFTPRDILDTHALQADVKAPWSSVSMAEALREVAEDLDRAATEETVYAARAATDARAAADALDDWARSSQRLWDAAGPSGTAG